MANTNYLFRNPALRLTVSSTAERVDGRGPKLTEEMKKRLPTYQARLGHNLKTLIDKFPSFQNFDGRILLWVKMRDDAINPGRTPTNLFLKTEDLLLSAPWRDGYIAEANLAGLQELAKRIANSTSVGKKCDIANILLISLFSEVLFKETNTESTWSSAESETLEIRLQTASYSTDSATEAVISYLAQTIAKEAVQLIQYVKSPDTPLAIKSDTGEPTEDPVTYIEPRALSSANELSQAPPVGRQQYTIIASINSLDTLEDIILSGSVVRWEPIENLSPIPPGRGEEPPLDREFDQTSPIVAVVDGGYAANRYRDAVAWEAPKVIDDAEADHRHGNVVASIIVDAHLWNNELDLEDWSCRLGVLQTVPKKGVRVKLPFEKVAIAIEEAMIANPDTKVWNLSANFDGACSQHDVSEAAHILGQIARKHGRLLVMSAGNRSGFDNNTISPPGDCEAALVVAGRLADLERLPSDPCPKSRTAFGPDFMTKPDLSWFSEQRILGGDKSVGTSFAAPLVSRLAAHCFKNIDDPNPDLVRALLINSADLPKYCKQRGFGTPSTFSHPWLSTDSSVLLGWTETIKAQETNRWAGIVIPPSMIVDGRIVGRIRLVAVLEPRVQRRGDQYIATRLQTTIQAWHNGEWESGSILKPIQSISREKTARSEHAKWQPVQCFEGKWDAGKGPKIDSTNPIIRVGGRVYWRHKYMFDRDQINNQEHEVSFAMTLQAADPNSDTYNEFRQLMVEVEDMAIPIEQEIETNE